MRRCRILKDETTHVLTVTYMCQILTIVVSTSVANIFTKNHFRAKNVKYVSDFSDSDNAVTKKKTFTQHLKYRLKV